MNLQTTALQTYQQIYPRQTLRQMSQQTGIQQTRLFRLLNGTEMRISEYESLHYQISKGKSGQCPNIIFKVLQNLKLLRPEQLAAVISDIHYYLSNNQLDSCTELNNQFLVNA